MRRIAAISRRFLPGVLLVTSAFAGTSCTKAPFVWVQNLPAEPQSTVEAGTIVPGDMLNISVFGQETLATEGRVRADGTIAMPLLGEVPVAGQTPSRVSTMLAQRLKAFVNDPHVTVVIQQSTVSVTTVGEIKQVGLIELESPATVLQAIGKAGGLTLFADRTGIYVLRTVSGVTRRIRFKYDELVSGERASTSFRLKSGDVLVVE